MNKYSLINYIKSKLQEVYPTITKEHMENIDTYLRRSADDEIYRLANAIDRFGVEVIMEVCK